MFKRYCITLQVEDAKRLAEIGGKKGVSSGVLIRMIVKEYLASQQGKEKE